VDIKYLESQGLVEHGLHTAIETLRLDDEVETSDQQLAPEDAQALLSFYRDSAEWRGTRRHATLEVLWHVGCRMSGLRALDLGDYDAESGNLRFQSREESGTRRPRCEYVPRDQASGCPSTRSPHPIWRGSITWQRNLGLSAETVAERVAATPSVIRRYYDDPEFGDELERRRGRTDEIDVREHLHPEDLEDTL